MKMLLYLLTCALIIGLFSPWTASQAAEEGTPRIGWWDQCPDPSLNGEIPIGFNLGLTGATAPYGVPQQQGAQLAVEEINASGYLGAAQFQAFFEDGGASPETAIEAMEKLINEDGVVAVVGPTFSAQAFAADPIAQEAGIPVMGVSNLATGITDMGEYVFRNSLLDQVQIPAAVGAVHELAGLESAAIIYSDNNEFTVTGYDVFAQTLADLEIELIAEETFQTGEVDFTSQLTNLIAAEPEAILVSALAVEAIPLLEQIKQLGYEGYVIGGNGLNAPNLLTDANAEGVIIGAAWHISNPSPINTRYVESFTEAYGFQPDQFATQAYTAVWLYATAIRCADSSDPAAIREALAAIRDFDSPLGLFSFDENRDPVHDPTVQIIRGGKFEVLTAEQMD